MTVRESQIFPELPTQLASTNIVHRAATSVTPQRVIVSGLLASLVIQSEKTSQLAIPNDDEIDEHEASTFSPWLPDTNPESVDPVSLINISGAPELQELIRLLCIEYRYNFSKTLSSQPALFFLLIWLFRTLSGVSLKIDNHLHLNQQQIRRRLLNN